MGAATVGCPVCRYLDNGLMPAVNRLCTTGEQDALFEEIALGRRISMQKNAPWIIPGDVEWRNGF